MTEGKSYTVKEWFADKIANELEKDIYMCDVFAILKETEKAVYAMLNLGPNSRKCMWVPKSVLIANEVGYDETGAYNHETLFIEDYNEAVEAFKDHWDNYN